MRQFLLIGLVLCLCFPAFPATTFEVTAHDTTATGNPGEEIVMGGYIYNLTSDTLTIEITRTVNDLPEGWSTSICLETCLAPWVSSTSGKIAPNDSLEYSLHFLTNTTPGTGKAALSFNEYRRTEYETYNFTATSTASQIDHQTAIRVTEFALHGNYPNPFNGSTMIRFFVNREVSGGTFQVYSLLGELVFEAKMSPLARGEHELKFSAIDFNGNVLPSGIYIYRISVIPEKGTPMVAVNQLTFIK